MTKSPLVLIVEDDKTIRANVRVHLERHGFACEEVSTASSALIVAFSQNPDLVLLDLGLPDRDGTNVLAELRQARSTPVIVLSARGRESDKVHALEIGADDYLTKPFSESELVARVKAVLRRTQPNENPGEIERFDALVWDRGARRIFVEEVEVHLSPVEYRLFCALALRPGKILTHAWLLQEVWGLESRENLHYVRIAVAGLRKKLEPNSDSPTFLHTEVGVGYRFFR